MFFHHCLWNPPSYLDQPFLHNFLCISSLSHSLTLPSSIRTPNILSSNLPLLTPSPVLIPKISLSGLSSSYSGYTQTWRQSHVFYIRFQCSQKLLDATFSWNGIKIPWKCSSQCKLLLGFPWVFPVVYLVWPGRHGGIEVRDAILVTASDGKWHETLLSWERQNRGRLFLLHSVNPVKLSVEQNAFLPSLSHSSSLSSSFCFSR